MKKKKILCFGDSNTWGCIPRWTSSQLPSERYDEKIRWPRVMLSELGPGWDLIEEGLGGRTTMFDAPGESYRRGDWYLKPCLLSHRPLDYVVIMLGTNDIQPRQHQDSFDLHDLKAGMSRLIDIIRALPECGTEHGPAQILILAPPPIKLAIGRPDVSSKYGNEAGCMLSCHFSKLYAEIAAEYDCRFLDAARYAAADDSDGVHFTRESHPKLGIAVAAAIRTMEQNVPQTTMNPHAYTPDIEM